MKDTNSTSKPQAIRIKDILLSSRLAKFRVDESVPLETMEKCAACTQKLTPISTLVSVSSKNKIRVGVCENCGYMGYMDRPTKEWLVNFYAIDWDQEFIRTPEQMKQDVVMQKGGVKGSRNNAFELHRKLPINKERPYFEIGSGYGQAMKNFEIAGFTKLYGIENSKHRAELVNKVFGYKIYHGDFGNPELTKEIKKNGPYGLIFSHHVLEHVYSPDQVIGAMAELQEEGDHAIFTLPWVDGEHINYVSLYWPHLHGFTKESLEILFNRHGYEMVLDGSPDILNLSMAFKKTANPVRKLKSRRDYVKTAKERFRKGLQIDNLPRGLSKLIWEQKITEVDTARVEKLRGGRIGWYISQAIAYVKSRLFKRLTAHYIMLVQGVSKRVTEDSTVEIQFDKDILFFIK